MTTRPPSSRARSVSVATTLTLVVLGALVLVSAALLPWAQSHTASSSPSAAGVGFTVQVGATGDVRFPLDAATVRTLPAAELGAVTDLGAVLAGSTAAVQLHQRWPQTVLVAGLVLGWVAGVLALVGLLRPPRVGLTAVVALLGLASVALVVAGVVQVLGLRQLPQEGLGVSLQAGLGAYLGVAGAVLAAFGGAGALLLPGPVVYRRVP
ncbi:MAG: hypothetical protein ABI181_15675 [Mycobacteriaceae bacterium]